jgi:uncharacterized protein YndB with AHSA1/START domain
MIYKVAAGTALILALLVVVAWNFHTPVSMQRSFSASEGDLWRVWNDPDAIQKWWGPKGYTAIVVRNDVRVGGSYLFAMKSAAGRMYWSTGVFKEVVPYKRIVSTMSFSNESGQVIPGSQVTVPGNWPDQVTVSVEFTQSQGRAGVTVTESEIPLIAYPLSKIGWSQQFDKIQSAL